MLHKKSCTRQKTQSEHCHMSDSVTVLWNSY